MEQQSTVFSEIKDKHSYIHSFDEMMQFLCDNPGSVVKSNTWIGAGNYHFYTMTSYGTLIFNTYSKEQKIELHSPSKCEVNYNLLLNKYALFDSFDDMIENS